MKLRIFLCWDCKTNKVDEKWTDNHSLSDVKVCKRTHGKQCEECKKKSINRISERMKAKNPMHREEIRKKVSDTRNSQIAQGIAYIHKWTPEQRKKHSENYKMSSEGKKKISDMMKKNNPMKKKEVIEKVKETFKRKIASGELKYIKGSKHHLYKGNRRFNLEVRKWLKPWIKAVLERDNYTCTKCKTVGGYLHVHHIRVLRDIIHKILTENDVKDINELKIENVVKYEEVMQKIRDEHKMSDGITLCKKCHGIVDSQYRRFKNKLTA